MTGKILPRHPMLVLDEHTEKKLGLKKPVFTKIISSTDVAPCAENAIWPGPVTFGKNGSWTPEKNDITFTVELSFSPIELFGEQGVACSDATLGASLEWKSVESRQRGHAGTIVEFNRKDKHIDGRFELAFAANHMRGGILLTVLLYVIDEDPDPKETERHLANRAGLFLGKLSETCTLVFDGTGSMFPIRLTDDGTDRDPLWRIEFNADDPEEDLFTVDNICLEINSKHPDYMILRDNEGKFESKALKRQVMASWLTLFFIILEEQHPDLYRQCLLGGVKNYEDGTIAYIADYIVSTHLQKTDIKTTESLSGAIQMFINNNPRIGV